MPARLPALPDGHYDLPPSFFKLILDPSMAYSSGYWNSDDPAYRLEDAQRRHGTIEPGKAADLLLYTGDPLDPSSRLRLTLIDGRTAYAN